MSHISFNFSWGILEPLIHPFSSRSNFSMSFTVVSLISSPISFIVPLDVFALKITYSQRVGDEKGRAGRENINITYNL